MPAYPRFYLAPFFMRRQNRRLPMTRNIVPNIRSAQTFRSSNAKCPDRKSSRTALESHAMGNSDAIICVTGSIASMGQVYPPKINAGTVYMTDARTNCNSVRNTAAPISPRDSAVYANAADKGTRLDADALLGMPST